MFNYIDLLQHGLDEYNKDKTNPATIIRFIDMSLLAIIVSKQYFENPPKFDLKIYDRIRKLYKRYLLLKLQKKNYVRVFNQLTICLNSCNQHILNLISNINYDDIAEAFQSFDATDYTWSMGVIGVEIKED